MINMKNKRKVPMVRYYVRVHEDIINKIKFLAKKEDLEPQDYLRSVLYGHVAKNKDLFIKDKEKENG
jgi:predicted DNA binding CopG/RHH family protein